MTRNHFICAWNSFRVIANWQLEVVTRMIHATKVILFIISREL